MFIRAAFIKSCGPDIFIGKRSEYGHRNQFSVQPNGLARRLHHIKPTRGMHIGDGRWWDKFQQ